MNTSNCSAHWLSRTWLYPSSILDILELLIYFEKAGKTWLGLFLFTNNINSCDLVVLAKSFTWGPGDTFSNWEINWGTERWSCAPYHVTNQKQIHCFSFQIPYSSHCDRLPFGLIGFKKKWWMRKKAIEREVDLRDLSVGEWEDFEEEEKIKA